VNAIKGTDEISARSPTRHTDGNHAARRRVARANKSVLTIDNMKVTNNDPSDSNHMAPNDYLTRKYREAPSDGRQTVKE
jgi:hypothetical protein